MRDSSRPDPTPATPDDGDPAWRPAWGFLAAAIGLMAGAMAWWASTALGQASNPPPAIVASGAGAGLEVRASQPQVLRMAAASAPSPGASSPASAGTPQPPTPMPRHVVRHRDPDGDQTPDLADFINDGDIPSTAEVIDRLHQAGIHEGLGAFQPPGTRPPLMGLAVPEGFELPPGYVRHYQATDDGQRIEAVLMFAPDAHLVDANGQPVAIPADRVVPPEMAPPGLPLRRITIPAPLGAPRRER